MFEDKKDNTFLSRWINDELSDRELDDFKKHPDYREYQKIKQASAILAVSDYDTDLALDKIHSKLKKTPQIQSRKVVIKRLSYFALAASIALLVGLFLFSPSATKIEADYGQQLSVALPDGSQMVVNANSTAAYSEKNWETNREVILDGEAYFKVKKGSTFRVKTNNGTVQVLGTQFNVNAIGSLFEVICYEGKVAVKTSNTQKVLTPTQGLLQIDAQKTVDFEVAKTQPSWLSYKSVFRSIPFKYVLIELKKHYKLSVDTTALKNQDMRYTGSFPHNNLDIALRTVFSTLGLQYTISKDRDKTNVVLSD